MRGHLLNVISRKFSSKTYTKQNFFEKFKKITKKKKKKKKKTLGIALSMKTLKAVLANIFITLLVKIIIFGIFIFIYGKSLHFPLRFLFCPQTVQHLRF